jgi:pimeloyl-ACP methyl ester carboxylesterase
MRVRSVPAESSLGIERARVGEIEIAYQTFGQQGHPVVLLIMGLGGQMVGWHDDLIAELVGRDLFVVRFDNRDVGLSTHLDSSSGPAPYSLSDMAGDAVGLVSALGFDSAHFVGISMGGMIAQTAAIERPEAVKSLTSIASTNGSPEVGCATPEAVEALRRTPEEPTRETVIETALALTSVIGSTGFEIDRDWGAWRAGASFDRSYDPAGVARQSAAIGAQPDRTVPLSGLRIPALVIHGSVDPLIDVSGGRATADAIPGAELLEIEGMGHDLPRGVWTGIADAIEQTVRQGEASEI